MSQFQWPEKPTLCREMRNSGIFLILAFDLKQICLFIVFLSIQRLQTNDSCNLSRKAVCVLVHFSVSLWKHQIVWVRYARMFEHTSVCIVCMCKNVDYIYSYLDVCRFVCTLHILCVQWIVWVGLCVCGNSWQPPARVECCGLPLSCRGPQGSTH